MLLHSDTREHMQPEQIKIAVKELICEVDASQKPANDIMNAYTRSRRYIGSKDRRLITDLVWQLIRTKARLNYQFPQASIFEKIDFLLAGEKIILPKETPDWVRYEVPEWLMPFFGTDTAELEALLQPAPIVLRAVGNRIKIQKILLDEQIETEPTQLAPQGLILKKRTNLSASLAYRKGLIEIQDEGSQLAADTIDVAPHDTILDYCAGAGGKTLFFAQKMHGQGHIIAHDISQIRMKPLLERAKRAGVAHIIQIASQKTDQWINAFKHVIADAPCSGTGTWRRCPDARWHLTQNHLEKIILTQRNILNETAEFVAVNGILSYLTCSLLRVENDDQVNLFLKTHPNFKLIEKHYFTPATTHTDGFFVARFQKKL